MSNRHRIAASLLTSILLAPAAHSLEWFVGVNLASMSHEGLGLRDYECPPWTDGESSFSRWEYCAFDYDRETSNFGYLRLGAKFNKYLSGELRTGLSRNNSGTYSHCSIRDGGTSNLADILMRHPPQKNVLGDPCFRAHIKLDSIIFAGAHTRVSLPVRPWLQPYVLFGYTTYSFDLDFGAIHIGADPVIAGLLEPLGKTGYDFTYGIGFDIGGPVLNSITLTAEYQNNDRFGAFSLGITYTHRRKP